MVVVVDGPKHDQGLSDEEIHVVVIVDGCWVDVVNFSLLLTSY